MFFSLSLSLPGGEGAVWCGVGFLFLPVLYSFVSWVGKFSLVSLAFRREEVRYVLSRVSFS
jgi:hypothetical protein